MDQNLDSAMSSALVGKLLQSFDELERCITLTKQVLAQKNSVPAEIVERVSKYSEVVAKQRQLAHILSERIAAQDWEEVTRHVRLINGLSSMIRDDAQAILRGSEGEAGENVTYS
jgi:hypothetical protein